jgi:hypothetical protein
VNGDISAEVLSTDFATMVEEGKNICNPSKYCGESAND